MSDNTTTWAQLAGLNHSEIIDWAASQPWAQEMAACMQEPLWHAEGDVWTHTKMVCDELFKLDDWDQLDRKRQLTLLLTAIFHDSGKPATTALDEETGRIRSPRHAERGMRIARRVLMELGCDVATRERVCHLILFHGRPPYLSKKRNPGGELIKLSWYLDHRLLYLFALADMRGRICESDEGRAEETIEMWKLVAQENDCFESPFNFSNDHARFLFYRGKTDSVFYAPHEDYRCTMTIMCGLPGSGKNTWLAENEPELPVVSLDAFRQEMKVEPTGNQGVIVQAAREQCKSYLRSHQDFALNATNTTRQVRKLWIDIGADYNARISIVYVEPDLQTLFSQNASREKQVPGRVIQRLIDKFDPPTIAECHQLRIN